MRNFSLFDIDGPGLIFVLIVAFIIFLAIREIITWYWKINRIVELLEKIEENTRPEIVSKKAEAVSDQEPQPIANKDQINQKPRTTLDKWWNGPDKYNLP